MKISQKIISLTLSFVIFVFGMTPVAFADDGGSGDSQASTITTTTANEKYGNWKFKVTTTTDSSVSPAKVTKTAMITQYCGTTDTTVVVPGVLDGAIVTEIGSQAFARHGEILALYIPNGVTTIDSWAFYDCNSVAVVSIANANVNLNQGAFQSNPNVTAYLNSGYSDENVNMLGMTLGGSDKVSRSGYTEIAVDITNSDASDSNTSIEKTLYAPYGTYLNVDKYPIIKADINVIPRGTGCTVDSGSSDGKTYIYTISGTLTGVVDYTNNAAIADNLKGQVTVNDCIITLM